ncbi:MAG: caspase family protein [Leptolyngbyaceae cyanobacterium CSU_1_3]|nr:caspase family protein [Leptolyngbyaceae cyanobacterium CSU_1_3]
MPTVKRRHFLQGVGSTVAAIGLGQTNLFRQAQQFDRVLAQGKPGRKLALLVGINRYTQRPLSGCHTDVELQWELLVHRYGFSPNDILVVADREFSFLNYKPQQPTRQNILEAFEKHLIGQATADSTVVFHYSGHGGLIKDPNPLPYLLTVDFDGNRVKQPNSQGGAGTILPIDYATNNPEETNPIMGRTLFLLTYALAKKTPNITMVLDSCHSGGSFRGNLTVRTVNKENGIPQGQPGAIELDYQKRWLRDLNLEAKFQELRQAGIAAGVAIGSVQYDQLAADARFDGFQAGALTYTLTRYLWQQPVNDAIEAVFANIASRTQEIGKSSLSDQQPLFDVSRDEYRKQPIYLSQPAVPFADAVVRQVSSKDDIQYWLGGVSTRSLTANATGTLYSIVNPKGEEIGQLKHLKREGLRGFGRVRPLPDTKVTEVHY